MTPAPDDDPGPEAGASSDPGGVARLDVWLWCARFRRSRADCARMVAEGAVRLNRRPVDRPGARVRIGDVLTLAFGPDAPLSEFGLDTGRLAGRIRVVRVLGLAARRGGAEAARRLFEELDIPDAAPPAG